MSRDVSFLGAELPNILYLVTNNLLNKEKERSSLSMCMSVKAI